MNVKKIVKLINNERINSAVLSNKAIHCIRGASDTCNNIDISKCDTYAYDYCEKEDRASCSAYADDTCTYDYYSYNCYGINTGDNCYIDHE